MVVYNEPTNTSFCDLSTWNGAFNTSEICISQSWVENDNRKLPKWRKSTLKTARAQGPLDSQGPLRQVSSSIWRWVQGSRWGVQLCFTFPVFSDGTCHSVLTVEDQWAA
jgi:hypothetical protein